jgi:hypothetical protein
MKSQLFIYDYLTAQRLKKENDFVLYLNQKELKWLIKGPLIILINRVYTFISANEQSKIDLEQIPNEEKINSLLQEKLSGHKLYDTVKNHESASYLFTDAYKKLYKRLFEKDGHNDEKYIIQSYIHCWLEDNLAELIARDNRFSSLVLINKLLDQAEMLHRFYSSFKSYVSKAWIIRNVDSWVNVTNNYSSVLDFVRTFDGDYFRDYEHQLNEWKTLSPWKFIQESTRGAEYAMLNTEYTFRNSILFKKDISLWIKFWDNLRIPVLQDIALLYLSSPFDYGLIAKEITKQKAELKSSPKHLTFLMINNLFDSMRKAEENLSFFINQERIANLSNFERDDELIKLGQETHVKWEKEKKTIFSKVFKEVSPLLTYDELGEWVFSYRPREVSSRNEFNKQYNEAIKLLTHSFNAFYSEIPFENKIQSLNKNFNLTSFNALMSQPCILKISPEQVNELLHKLSDFICSESFYWDKTFSEMYWHSIKNIGKLLSLSEKPIDKAFDLVDQFRTINEGWNVSKIDYKIYQREAYVICGVMLLLEYKKSFDSTQNRKLFLNKILNHTISQIRFSSYEKEDYLMALYLSSFIIEQLYPSLKSKFETRLIQDIDDVIFVLKVLANDGYKISPKGKKLLKKRCESEIPLIKRRLLQKNFIHEMEEIESVLKKLN